LYSPESLTIEMITYRAVAQADRNDEEYIRLRNSNKAVLRVLTSDQLSVLEVTDPTGKVVATGLGGLYRELISGFYRVSLLSPDGQKSEKFVQLSTGEIEEITLQSPSTLRTPSELIPRAGSEMLYGAKSGLRIIVDTKLPDNQENLEFIENLRIRFWPQNRPIPESSKSLHKLFASGSAEYAIGGETGSYWLSLESPNKQPIVFSLAILRERTTLLVLQRNKDGNIRIFLYTPLVNSPQYEKSEDILHLRKLDILQQFYTSDILDYFYEDVKYLAYQKWHDPMAGCVAGYLMFKNLAKREKSDLVEIARNMTEHFSEISDSFVLNGKIKVILDQETEAVISYREALEIGVPIFAEGLATLYHAMKEYDLNDAPYAQQVKSAFEQRLRVTPWSCWTPSDFRPGELVK